MLDARESLLLATRNPGKTYEIKLILGSGEVALLADPTP